MDPAHQRAYDQWITDGRPGNKHPRSLMQLLRFERVKRERLTDELKRTEPHTGHDAGLAPDGPS